MLQFWPHFYKHWNSSPYPFKHCKFSAILTNIEIVYLSFQTLEFLPYTSKHWNLTIFFETLEFWLYFYKHWTSRHCPSKHCNSVPFFINIGFLALVRRNIKFSPFTSKYSSSNLFHPYINILAHCI